MPPLEKVKPDLQLGTEVYIWSLQPALLFHSPLVSAQAKAPLCICLSFCCVTNHASLLASALSLFSFILNVW